MSLKRNFIDEINLVLMTQIDENDTDLFTLNIPEHKFKKYKKKLNYAFNLTYEKYKDMDIKLYHIILALQEYFDIENLITNLLDEKLNKVVKKELEDEFHIKDNKKNGKK
jgi:hypothetical protein